MGSDKFEELLYRFRKPLTLILGGLTLIGAGIIIYKSSNLIDSPKIEVVKKENSPQKTSSEKKELVAEISGEVQKPGVYKLDSGSRVDDLLVAGGGLSASADREWVEKNINRAAKISDGQKVYIPHKGEVIPVGSNTSVNGTNAVNNAEKENGGLVDINTASKSELENLPGIGPVYAQNIIEGRIYSTTSELTSKGVISRSVFEKIKDKITVN